MKQTATKAKAELARRELARRHLSNFCGYTYDEYMENWHTRQICDALERVENGEIRYLLMEAPPRHSKSVHVSQLFPAWVVGRNPDADVIVASYSGDLATDQGRETRNLIETQEYANVFDTRLAPDSTAKAKWNTQRKDEDGNWKNAKGAYNAAGVGGSITGKGADFFIVDDPFKDRKEADSSNIRSDRWKWLTSVASTRLSPKGAVIIMHCMTGDTQVLMSDNTNKDLKDIKVGDKIATYDKGVITSSIVKNWANKGNDCIFTIKTESGKILRANERHPFLIKRDNKTTWIKLKDLKVGQQLVRVHGKGSRVNHLDVRIRQDVKASACRTIQRKGEKQVSDLHQLTQNHTGMHTLNTGTVFRLMNTITSMINKGVNVQYVNKFPREMYQQAGIISFVLTTVTILKRFVDYCVMGAISLLVTDKQKIACNKLSSIYDITTDKIVSIQQTGHEDVFDIEVERTENFIANGIVSHNTRWHEDDLIGRITDQKSEYHEKYVDYQDFLKNGLGDAKWVRLRLPAIAEVNEEHRKKGEALWPDRYNLEELLSKKKTLGPFEWSALYQQNPVDDDSREFKKEWMKQVARIDVPENTRKFALIDTALTTKQSSDYTGVVRLEIDQSHKWYVSGHGYKVNAKEIIDLVFKLHDEGFEQIGIEQGAFTNAIEPFMQEAMYKRNKFPSIIMLKHGGTMKEVRIRGLVPMYVNGKIHHVENECEDLENQMLVFPKGKNDDVLDALAYAPQLEISMEEDEEDYDMSVENTGILFDEIGL